MARTKPLQNVSIAHINITFSMHTTIVFLFSVLWILSKLRIGGSYDLPKYNKIFYKLEVNFTIEKYILCIEAKIICSPDIVIPLNIYLYTYVSRDIQLCFAVSVYILRCIYFYHFLCLDDSTIGTWNNETGLRIFSGRRQISFC